MELAPGLVVEAHLTIRREEDLRFAIVDLIVRPVSLEVFIELLEHSEDKDEGEGAYHGGWVLWREGEAGQDRYYEEVDVRGALELEHQR